MSSEAALGGVVDNLVTQFASALDCFRELVQNSIDAGTSRVDIWSEFESGDGHVGTIALHVDDFGEGMDEAIIDGQLTKLFASNKENDLTKIGKFGIGFVSVFALKPKAVLLHTGRGGEYWEVFFHEDRSFSKSRLDIPVEGTQITIFLEGDYHRYRDLAQGIRETLKRWCRHSETEVTFEDRSPVGDAFPELEIINEAFEVEGDCMVEFEEPGTQMVLAYSLEPVYGFYNRGLTLAYSEVADQVFATSMARRFAYIAVKIKSRYLEHTLSRDSVMRDEHYRTAMKMLNDVADDVLVNRLLDRLEEIAARPKWDIATMNHYAALFEFLMNEPTDVVRDKILDRRVFRALHGDKVYTPDEVWRVLKRRGRILLAAEATQLSQTLAHHDIPVFVGHTPAFGSASFGPHPLSFVHGAIAQYVTLRQEKTLIGSVRSWLGWPVLKGIQTLIERPESAYLAVTIDETPDAALAPLLRGATEVLKAAGIDYKAVGTCVPGNHVERAPIFVTGEKLSPLMKHPSVTDFEHDKIEAAVNRQHPFVTKLVELRERQPALADYSLARALLLHRDHMLDKDAELMTAAHRLHGLMPEPATTEKS